MKAIDKTKDCYLGEYRKILYNKEGHASLKRPWEIPAALFRTICSRGVVLTKSTIPVDSIIHVYVGCYKNRLFSLYSEK